MERHKCKLCTRSFCNGRALGGHMKAHLATLPLPKKTQQFVDTRIESASSASLAEEEEKNRGGGGGGGGEEKGLVYGLRENPKKSFRVADPGFSFVADAGSCVVVQDGESETESRNPTRRRSKRNRRFDNQKPKLETKKAKQSGEQSWINNNNNEYSSSPADPEPVSSVSCTSPEEDVAMCLMMLSRDRWMKEQDRRSAEKPGETKSSKKIRCEKCKKGFRSLQALGGHKRICEGKIADNDKIFECPFCFKVFGSGQALGGHKRSHILASSTRTATTPTKLDAVSVSVSIDLNLPAPAEEDEYSVVSDA